MSEMTFINSASKAKLARMRELLAAKPMTTQQLAEVVPISRRWAHAYVKHMKEQGQIRIGKWITEIDGGRSYPRPVYQTIAADAPKPEPKTSLQAQRDSRKRMKDDPERHISELMRKRATRLRKLVRPDPAAAWMFAAVSA